MNNEVLYHEVLIDIARSVGSIATSMLTLQDEMRLSRAITERIADLLEEQNDIASRAYAPHIIQGKDIVGDKARDHLYGERFKGR